MIPVAKVGKPKGYGAVKRAGDAWLRLHPGAKRPKDLWSPFLSHLADGFGNRCGYAAMLDPTGGTVDHYRSWNNYPHLAYEWSNLRFASHLMNSSKKTADDAILDPYLVQRGWFEVILPSLQLRVTSKVPAAYRAKAEYTLKRLKLDNGEKAVRWRRRYYERYEAGQLDLDGLYEVAPLIADAVERALRKSAKPRKAKPAKPRRAKPAKPRPAKPKPPRPQRR